MSEGTSESVRRGRHFRIDRMLNGLGINLGFCVKQMCMGGKLVPCPRQGTKKQMVGWGKLDF